MKLKTAPKSRVVVELEPGEAGFPPGALPEIRLKLILVPVDFSECSRKALQYASVLARQFNAEILLLHVMEPITSPPPHYLMADTSELEQTLREESIKALAQWRQQIVPPVVANASVRTGVAYREIIRAADETNADLIILGTHGRAGLAHLFLGSTAERVVRQAPCPALVVREREHDFLTETERRAAAATTPKRAMARG